METSLGPRSTTHPAEIIASAVPSASEMQPPVIADNVLPNTPDILKEETIFVSYEDFYKRAFSSVVRRVSAVVDSKYVDDIVNESFLGLWLTWDTVNKREPGPFNFLKGIVSHKIVDYYRSHARQSRVLLWDFGQGLPEDATDNRADDETENLIGLLTVQEAIQGLPAASQRLLAMLVEGTSKERLAEEFGISVSGVKSRLAMVRSTLRIKLAEDTNND